MKKRIFLLMSMLCLGFIMTACAYAASSNHPYSDVAEDAWYAEAVAYCQENGLMSGISQSVFAPDEPASRAMLVAVLYRQAGSPSTESVHQFSDMTEDAWYANAVDWAIANGIVSGYSDGRFGGDDPITREQLAAILWRSAGRPASGPTEAFADQESISPYAQEAVAWARNEGIVSGMADNRFEPEGIATRAQMAAMLCRLLGQVPPAHEYVDNLEEQTMPSLTIKIGNETFNATLLDNSTTRALLELLPLTATMTEMNGNEKYTYLSNSLPVNTERPERIQKGDLMLYGSDCLVLFYDSFATSYSYTRLGHIDDPAGLEAILTNGSVEVTFQVQ